MKTRHAARIRFGILAARFDFAGHRLTPGQYWDYQVYRDCDGLVVGDRGTFEPYERETWSIVKRGRNASGRPFRR